MDELERLMAIKRGALPVCFVMLVLPQYVV